MAANCIKLCNGAWSIQNFFRRQLDVSHKLVLFGGLHIPNEMNCASLSFPLNDYLIDLTIFLCSLIHNNKSC